MPRERLESLLSRLERLRHTPASAAGESPARAGEMSGVLKLPLPPASTAPGSDLATWLELVALRDQYIQTELLKLQRTLSRQTFRGAESARRLVRRLARRAEQNVTDLEALKNSGRL